MYILGTLFFNSQSPIHNTVYPQTPKTLALDVVVYSKSLLFVTCDVILWEGVFLFLFFFWQYSPVITSVCVCACVCRPLCLTIIDLVKVLTYPDGTCILRNVVKFNASASVWSQNRRIDNDAAKDQRKCHERGEWGLNHLWPRISFAVAHQNRFQLVL